MTRSVITGIALLTAIGCGDEAAQHTAPATVSHPVQEAELATVTLTEEAAKRLGIRVVPIERRPVERVHTLGGEVIIPPGRSLTITAPVAGTVFPASTQAALPGATVSAQQPLARLLPLPPDRDLNINVAEARYTEARLEAERVQKLYADRLVSARDYERAQANYRAAEATLQSARAQVEGTEGSATMPGAAVQPLVIRAPVAGMIRSVYVAPAQSVAAGALLFEIAQLDRLWVRVPVYVGEIGQLASDRPVAISLLGNQTSTLRARPVQAPPSANAAAASADLYYELTVGNAVVRPGERVSVAVPLRSGTSEQLVVPWSAILHDAQGGSWLYVQVKPLVYSRRRVDLSHVQGDNAILARGPAPGTMIVVEGAAELFGTEFGVGSNDDALADRAGAAAAPRHRRAGDHRHCSGRRCSQCARPRSTCSPSSRRRSSRSRPRRRASRPTRWRASSRAAGERAERHPLAADRCAPSRCSASRLGAVSSSRGTDLLRARQLVQERLAHAARQLPTVAKPPVILVAALLDQPGAEDRHLLEDAVADRADDPGALDHPAAPDGDPGRGQRGHLGPARPPAAGAGRSRPPAGARRQPRRGAARVRARR